MSALVFVELDEAKAKKSSLEAVSYGKEVAGDVTVIIFGEMDGGQADVIGAAGASKLLHVTDEKLATPNIMAYSSAIAEAMNSGSHSLLLLAKSSLGDPVSARVAIKTGATLAANVSELPAGDTVKKSIYTGKAFANTKLKGEKRIISIKKNAVEVKTDGASPSVEGFSPAINDSDFKVTV
ncbi:MAG: electron transfer flavoprotein subunit alpha/FixB family protein, partial [Cyclobacteriaceae bacterium]